MSFQKTYIKIFALEKRIQTGNKQVTKRVTERVTKPPSSSSSDLLIKKLIKNTTTTTTPLDEGLGIDIPDNSQRNWVRCVTN